MKNTLLMIALLTATGSVMANKRDVVISTPTQQVTVSQPSSLGGEPQANNAGMVPYAKQASCKTAMHLGHK